MGKIPLNVKVSLINNYIQTNYLKSRGKAEHEDIPISQILEDIKEDISTLDKENKQQKPEEIPLGLVLRDLKYYNDKQSGYRADLESILDQLNLLHETQVDPGNTLDKVIKDLETLNKGK